jgi:hypothetical protein
MINQANMNKRAAERTVAGPSDHVIYNNALQVPLRNWSPVGLMFGPMGTPPDVGQHLELKVAVTFRNDRLRFQAQCEVVRVEKGMVAVRYECAAPETAAQIKAYFAGK